MPAYKWIVFSNTTIGSFMVSIDGSIVLISLPTILRTLPGTSANDALWVVMSYMLVSATLLLNLGRLGDMFGKVKIYTIGFAIFTAGSFLCSLSQTGTELVGFRLCQAVGAAFLWANSGALITDAFPLNERGTALGMNQVVLVTGQISGLILGGVLTAELGWRSIFWVNVPIGVFATLWAYKRLREIGTIEKKPKLDVWGNATFAAGLSIVLLGITLGALESWNLTNYAMIAIGGVLLVLFVFIEQRVPQPMFDLSLFKLKVFTSGNISGLTSGISRGAFTFVMSFYLQAVLGDSPLIAGILLIPLSISVGIIGPISGILSDRFGSFYFAVAGFAVSGAAFVMMHQLPAQIGYALLVVPLLVMGAGWGMMNSPIRSETLSAVPPERRGIGSAVTMTLMNVGLLASLTITILIVSSSVPHSVVIGVFGGGMTGAGGPTVTDISDFMRGLHNVYALSAALSFFAILPMIYGFRGLKSREERAQEEAGGVATEEISTTASEVEV